jgi:hypothetical protein
MEKIMKTVEEWKALKFPEPRDLQEFIKNKSWLFGAAKAKYKWVIGEELSEEDFDECISNVMEHSIS